MNMLIIGGSGSSKTSGIVIPNILLGNCSNVIMDIKGDLLKQYGNYLKAHGIVVKSLNLKNPLESDRFNPFLYIKNYSDLIGLITNIQNSITPPDAQKRDLSQRKVPDDARDSEESGNTTAALTYTAAEVGQMLGIGRTYTYEYLKKVYKEKAPFTVLKFGSLYKIPKHSFDAWLLSL